MADLTLLANQLIWGILVGVSYSLLAIAFSLIFATSGTVNFATGEFAMVGAYFCYTILSKLGGQALLAVLLSLVGLFVFGMLVERIAFRRLYKLDPILILIATIGISTLLKSLVLIVWGPYSKSLPPLLSAGPIAFGPIILMPQNLVLLAVGLGTMVIFHVFMNSTRLGTAMRATAQNVKGASLVGINTARCVNLTWAIGSVVAGIGGILIAFAYNLSIDMGGLIGIKGFASAVTGGFGNILASTYGGLVLGVAENLAGGLISFYYKDVIAFGFIVLVLFLRPSGLFVARSQVRKV
jgi:branched-chain amino acid transport system permease protein